MARLRNPIIAAALAAALTGLIALPALDEVRRLDIDVLHALRELLGTAGTAGEVPVAVVAIDEATYVTPPFSGLPKVMWTPQIAAVQDAILAAGAAVVGWDVILPTSAARYVADRRFDAPLLQSLSAGGKAGRIVLGTAGFGTTRIAPSRLFALSVGGAVNLRSLNVVPDPDGIVRQMPTFLRVQDQGAAPAYVPSMSLELARRGGGVEIARIEGGGLKLGATVAPGVREDALLLNFDSRARAVPTYSLADLHACAAAGETDFFARQFKGKIVLIGLVLDIEDRRLASNRLVNRGGPVGPEVRCRKSAGAAPPSSARRATLSGVYLQATAVGNLLAGTGLRTLPPLRQALATAPLALLAAMATLGLGLAGAVLLTLGGMVAWTLGAVLLLDQAQVLPLLGPLLAGLAGFVGALAIRFLILDREGRFLRRAFATYVAPAIVDELVANPGQLKLGGERREMSFLFTDIAGFTGLIEDLDPAQAGALLNAYLDRMIDIAKRHGGTIDKVIGDAVVVIFSAPVDQQDHAERAIACALEMDAFAERFARDRRAEGLAFGNTRIGVHSGEAIVGNLGGSGFFDYTALGDAMNTAARLESVNKHLGTRVAVSGEAVRRCTAFVGRPAGRLVLKGKTAATEVFEPLPGEGPSSRLRVDYAVAYDLLERNDPKAKAAFRSLAKAYPDDPLTRFHRSRLDAGEVGATIALAEK